MVDRERAYDNSNSCDTARGCVTSPRMQDDPEHLEASWLKLCQQGLA